MDNFFYIMTTFKTFKLTQATEKLQQVNYLYILNWFEAALLTGSYKLFFKYDEEKYSVWQFYVCPLHTCPLIE